MKKSLLFIMALALCGMWACATSPPATSSADGPDEGDRELKRGIYWYQKGCTRKALEYFHAAHEHYSLTDQQVGTVDCQWMMLPQFSSSRSKTAARGMDAPKTLSTALELTR